MSDKPGLIPSIGLLFAVLFSIASFLAQKETDKIDEDIDSIRDSVADITNFKLNYISGVEDAYLDNVTEFTDLVKSCNYIVEKSNGEKDYCSHDYPDAGELKISDLRKAFRLFSETYLDPSNSDGSNFDINKLIEADSFLRHHIKYSSLQSLLSNNKSLRETVGDLQADWAYLGDIASKNKDILARYNDEAAIRRIHNKDLERLSFNICCTVTEMHNSSVSLFKHLNSQLDTVCEIRKTTHEFLKSSYENFFYKLLSKILFYNKADEFLAELGREVDRDSDEPNKRCGWSPRPPCSFDDVCDSR